MTVELHRLVSLTAGIVDQLAWSACADQAEVLEFVFRVNTVHVPARLTMPASFPAELPEIHLSDEILRDSLAHVDGQGKLCFSDGEGLSLSLRDATAVLAQALHDGHRVLAAGLAGTNRSEILDELFAYWALHCRDDGVRVALDATDRIKSLDLWIEGTKTVLITDHTERRHRFGQDAAALEPKGVGLYLPLPGERFNRPFLDALARGQVSLTSCVRQLDEENRKILSSKLKNKRRFGFIVFGVAVGNGERALIGAALTPAQGRKAFESSIPLGAERWAPRTLTRVDRGALLPRGGVRNTTPGHAMVIGCGALGGHVAMAIARTGLRRLTLVDPEELTVENIYRHVLGYSVVGQPKAAALADQLADALPHLDVRARMEHGEQLPDALFDEVDLVLVTVGTATIHRMLNKRLHARRCRVVFGWLEPMGIGGHALLTGAAEGCLECVFLEPDGEERLTAWSDFAAPGQRFARHHAGCAGAFTPFADLDARRTANVVVELGLEALAKRDVPGCLRSWLGTTEAFTEAGFLLSNLPRRELITEFRQTRCPVCGVGMTGLVYERPDELVLKIDGHALAKLLAHAQHDCSAPEAGGVLLGRWLIDGGLSFVVDDISEPMPSDRRTRTSFFRSGPSHTQTIEASLRDSGHTRGYLGEWHTHPEPVPTPSDMDRGDWRRRLHHDAVDLPCVFFVIVGTAELGVWAGDREQRRLTYLQCAIADGNQRASKWASNGP